MTLTKVMIFKWILIVLSTLSFVSTFTFAQNLPKSYTAYKTIDSLRIDGKPNEKSWQQSRWSDNFIDIEGEKIPQFQTRMKMLWSDEYFYIFAELQEPHVWANLKQHDTIIFYNNDFEVFIDPDGDTHNYYEYEMNALNTVWDLFLSKPYRNNGTILNNWDFKGLKSAVSVQGSLNNSSDEDQSWSVEIAIPWSFNSDSHGRVKPPTNEYWRINFSRLQWQHDIINQKYYRKKDSVTGQFLKENNWVWSPQEVINMHEPEHWGFVYFSTKTLTTDNTFMIPQDEHIKNYFYKLLREYRKNNNEDIIQQSILILDKQVDVKFAKHPFGWAIWTVSPFTNKKLILHDDGKFETID